MTYRNFPLKNHGGSYDEVDNYASLPNAMTVNGSIFVVLNSSGIFPFNKSKGFYYAFSGSWSYLGDFSPLQIKSMYESNADTNPFTNADKAKLQAVSEGEILIPMFCLSDCQPMDIVVLNTEGDNRVNSINTNIYNGLAIGILKLKMSSTTAFVQLPL